MTDWNFGTPIIGANQHPSAHVFLRVSGSNPSDPAQDTFQQIPLASITGTSLILASEGVLPGAFVNIWNNAGVLSVCNANASNPALFATGFCPLGAVIGAYAAVIPFGLNTAVAVGAVAAQVWLSDIVPGGFLTAPPTTAGHIVQLLGMAIPSVGISFTPQASVLL